MKKFFSTLSVAAVAALLLTGTPADAQRTCGRGLMLSRMAAQNPEQFRQWHDHQEAVVEAAAARHARAKTTASQYPIPVVFHFVVTTAQYTTLGNDSGIKNRVRTQLASLNRDYNRKNGDSSLIPAAFKSRFGNVGVQFAIAKATNSKTISPGIEVLKLTGTPPKYNVDNSCYDAKVAGSTGLAAWDGDKYLNIWVCDIYDPSSSGSSQILGVTTPPSDVNFTYMGHKFDASERGVVLSYGAVGVRTNAAQNFFTGIDLGRTLTHEIGHYFEISHIWGDDGGKCPSQSGGQDDNITDTPPQADATYCNNGTCPTFPQTDACSATSPGIMFMNYMDYVDDKAMMMFSAGQATRMQTMFGSGGESYSLTQNPTLATGVNDATVATAGSFRIYPNPAKGDVQVALDGSVRLSSIDVVNMLGQSVSHTEGTGELNYTLSLGSAPRGLYTVQCHFDGGTVTQKIVLE